MKILVIHASAGAGHRKAAEALYNGLKNFSAHNVVLIDALDYSSPLYKKLYQGTYTFLITRVPSLWGGDIPFDQSELACPICAEIPTFS